MDPTATRGIGLMCGTSHDGLDIADVSFWKEAGMWNFHVHESCTVSLPNRLKGTLDQGTKLSAEQIIQCDRDVARFFAHEVNAFSKETNSTATFIASHGVTIFHQPEAGLAWQAGNGGIISTLTNLPVISDFRIQDVSAGGTGAPLIPVADQHLFSEYNQTLNLGGFANITSLDNTLVGYDICACNLLLNKIAEREGKPFDAGGTMARSGAVNPELLTKFNAPAYFELPPPKSLGYEWFDQEMIGILDKHQAYSTIDLMATAAEHISSLISRVLPDNGKILITGGGAYNAFLIEQIQASSSCQIVLPEKTIIDFREAIAFAFLGLLRLQGLPNTSTTVTGARSPHASGALYLPPSPQV